MTRNGSLQMLNYQEANLIKRVDNLKRLVGEKASIVDKLESEYEDMNHTINSYLEMNKDQESRSKVKDVKVEKNDKDCLVFHGVMLDDMERMTADEDIRRNFLDHNIKKLLQAEWDIECTAPFKHVFRWSDGPRVNGVEPILVIFEDPKDKEFVWTRLRDNLQTKTNVVVTQDSSSRRITKTKTDNITRDTKSRMTPASPSKKLSTIPPASPRKTAVVKPTNIKKTNVAPEKVKVEEERVKKISAARTPTPEAVIPRKADRKISRSLSRASVTSSVSSRSPKKSLSRQDTMSYLDSKEDDDNIYGGLDASLSLMMHGVETDWIEEEMSDDDDFRKDVLEQKIKKVLDEIGFSKKIIYKNLFRWQDGPTHNGVLPVVVIFKEKRDKMEVYNVCREGLKKSGWVATEDSRSRLGGQKPKEISTKLNFSSFLDHYQSYVVAQQLYNKMIRLL